MSYASRIIVKETVEELESAYHKYKDQRVKLKVKSLLLFKESKFKNQEESLKVYTDLERKFRAIDRDPEILPNHILNKATAYCLNELESIYKIIISTRLRFR